MFLATENPGPNTLIFLRNCKEKSIQAREGSSKKYIVRGYKRCKFHVNIFDEVERKESAAGAIKFDCPGGGRFAYKIQIRPPIFLVAPCAEKISYKIFIQDKSRARQKANSCVRLFTGSLLIIPFWPQAPGLHLKKSSIFFFERNHIFFKKIFPAASFDVAGGKKFFF